MNDQLILKFPSQQAYKKEDFYVSPSNQQAYDFINSWPKWLKRTVNIYGPSGSGKSHLASILKNKTSCLKIDASELDEKIFMKFKTKEALIIENMNVNLEENLFFSLWNTAQQDNKYLLITSTKPISSFQFKLKDLISRVKSCLIIGISLPTDDLISVIIAKNFTKAALEIFRKNKKLIIIKNEKLLNEKKTRYKIN